MDTAPQSSAASAHPPLAVLDPNRLRLYALQWRHVAYEWAARAGDEHSDKAARLRCRAQLALFAAHEIDQLLESRGLPGSAPVPSRLRAAR